MIKSYAKYLVAMVALMLLTVGYSAKAVTLAQLISNNGTMTSGNLTFSNFTYTDSGVFSVPVSSVIVTPTFQPFTQNYGLSFTAGWVVTGLSADYNIGYVVTAPSATLHDYELNLNGSIAGSTNSNGNGMINVSESVTVPPNNTLDSIQAGITMVNGVKTLNHLSSSATYPLQSSILISKDVYVSADSNTVTHLSEIDQTYSQVPEPSALMMLFGSGICGSLFFLRKKSIA